MANLESEEEYAKTEIEYAKEGVHRALFCPCEEANWLPVVKEEGIGGRIVWSVMEWNANGPFDGFACCDCGRIASSEPHEIYPTVTYRIIGNISRPPV